MNENQIQLSPRHEEFCQIYVSNGGNGTQAVLAVEGYTDHEQSAANRASQLLNIIDVQLRIAQIRDEMAKRIGITREEVLNGLAQIAKADIRKVYNECGTFKHVSEIDDDTAMAIESIDETSGISDKGQWESRKIKMSSKLGALRDLGKHFGIYEEHEKAGAGNVQILITGNDVYL